MISFKELEDLVTSTGFWADERRLTHNFLLSPDVYRITGEQAEELRQLGCALQNCLRGISAIMAGIKRGISHGRGWNMINGALSTGVPDCYRAAQSLHPHRTPGICKVDLMVEKSTGRFYIAEIDGHNKHGLGYSTLARRMLKLIDSAAQTFPGAAAMLAKLIRNRNEGGNFATLLYADQERFYLPECEILQRELAAQHGIELEVTGELGYQLSQKPGRFSESGRPQILPELFVDLPFLYRNLTLNNALFSAYQSERVDFIIPPKPFFGSKAMLALLRNDEVDPVLEAILKAYIDHGSLALIRRYIPPTYLVSKHKKPEYWRDLCNGDLFVLKGSVSSGMKKVSFPDEPTYQRAFELACGSYYYFVLQKQIENQPFRFRYFDTGGQLQENDWFLRVTVQYCIREVADVIVTARQDRKVHGAKDCLQLGAVVV